MGRPYPDVFRDGLGFPTVKVEMEFLSPVHYGDHVDIDVTIERVGRSSVQIRYEASVAGKPVFKLSGLQTGGDATADGERFLVSTSAELPHREIRLFIDWAAGMK